MFSKTILFGLGRPPKDIRCIFLVPRPHSPWQQWSHVTLWVTVSHGLPCYPITQRWTHGEPPIGSQETSWREENDGPSALTSFLPDAERFQTNISFSVKRSSLWEHIIMLHVKDDHWIQITYWKVLVSLFLWTARLFPDFVAMVWCW